MSWNFSRFLKNVIKLEDEQKMISEMVRRLREDLMTELPDFGKHLGYDGKSIGPSGNIAAFLARKTSVI
jgi:hypothetical protein